ncbi:MAG: TIM barrel protein [Planctomycetota bacterium]|nr:TIM barrel protein [Planctomycetota bacterium]
MATPYRFTLGPWNIHPGADPFGPPVRPPVPFDDVLAAAVDLRFDGIQFHDDDAVPNLENLAPEALVREAREMRKRLDDLGLVPEFVAPRLWEHTHGIDGGYTSNCPAARTWAIERSKRAVDVALALGCSLIVMWPAREGTAVRESKNPIAASGQMLEAIDAILAAAPEVRIAIEPKPNEPVDHAFVPTIGHALALGARASDPARVGVLIETAHAILAGLDPSDEMGFALAAGKLWSVHLNDQNGLKFDQDKVFGAANLRGAFDQVRVLEAGRYADTGAFIGFDVKAQRTQRAGAATAHLATSRRIFELLVAKVRSFPERQAAECIATRDYESLERLVLEHLLAA